MGKITILLEAGMAGLVNAFELRKQPPGSKQSDSMYLSQSKEKQSLKSFILNENKNRRYLLIASVGAIIQFIIFKILYPFPDFISDSYSYIDTNLYDMSVNLWPIGYSKYLKFIHYFSSSDTFLVFTQFLILEISFIYFLFSIILLYKLKRTSTNILFIFLFFNPLFLYL